jgi:Domain of unknown function (DUF4190)
VSYPNNLQSQSQQPPVQQWSGPPSPGHRQQASSPSNNGLAIAALVMSILFAPVGLVLAYIARPQVKRTGEGGWGLTTAALIIGWIQLAPFIIALFWGFLFLIFRMAGVGGLLRPFITLGGSAPADEAAVAGVLTAVVTVIVVIVLVVRAARKT